MQIVVAGHVDHGKSTVIGRMLADSGSLPEGKLEQVRATCERNSRPFEYAFLLDALKDEQAQGITIDSARVFFETAKRPYLILDAPGHIEFLKNMITGASHAEAALLVIDAKEGVRENSRRHGYMLSMLGIRQIAVLVNKMDLVDYREDAFRAVATEYRAFLKSLGVTPTHILPVSGMQGDNVASTSERLAWFDGPTVLGALDGFVEAVPAEGQPFRMPVQDVYKFTKHGDDRRIVAGSVASGRLEVGDEVVFYPSGKRSTVKAIEGFARAEIRTAGVGEATGFTLDEQIYVTRGEIATRASEPPPEVTTRFRASLFWLGREAMVPKKDYLLRLGASKVTARLESIERVIDASSLAAEAGREQIERHEVAECVIRVRHPIAFDVSASLPTTGRFVIVDDYDIRGGGIVREALSDAQAAVREKVFLRNNRWVKSFVGPQARAERFSQKAALVLVTGPKAAQRKEVAQALEERLVLDGKLVYFLGFGSVLYGVDADLARGPDRASEPELMRRLGEVAHILLDAGVILVVSAQALTQDDLEIFKTTVDPEQIQVVWVGEEQTTDVTCDLDLGDAEPREAVDRIKGLLRERGVIFNPW